MIQVRHKACGFRLFDSEFPVESISGTSPDISIKCPRCSREHEHLVLAQYRFMLPRSVAPMPPERVYCQNLKCLHRILDMGIPYTIMDRASHISVLCPKCRELTRLRISGVLDVE